MHILDLPFEILTEIFLYLVPPETLEYALVCKSWTEPALCILYQDLHLGSRANSSVRQHLTLGMSERDEYFKYGNLVQKVKLFPNGYNPSEKMSGEELITFLEYFPNIKTLDISKCKFHENYYYYLINTKSKKCLSQIQTFEFPHYDCLDILKMHYSLCFKYRATISTMWFEYEDMINIGAEKLGRTLDYLKQFPNLKDLTIRNYDGNTTVTIFELQKACPNLTSLDYGIKLDGTEKQISAFLDDPANCNLQNHLKSLFIRSSIPVEYLKYLNSCVFTQLSVLKMRTNSINLYDWLADMEWDNVETFLSRLSTLDTVLLHFAPTFSYRKYGQMPETKMTTFFKLVDVFKGNKDPFCQMDIADCQTVRMNYDSLEYNSVDGLHLSYGLEDCDYQKGDCKTPNINFILPDVSISGTGLEIVNCLFAIFERDQSRDLQFKFIDHVLTNYPNLELFDFFCRRKLDERITIGRDANHSMDTKKKYHLSATNTKENLRSIESYCFFPLPKMLRMIATHLPNIEFASCINPVNISGKSHLFKYNTTIFKNLKTFHFEIEFVSRHMDFGFVCFDYGKEGNAIYYHQETSPYSLNACDESFMVECYSKDTVRSCRINIKCKKNTRVIVSSCGNLMAEFEDGVILDYINKNSYIRLPRDKIFFHVRSFD